MMIADKIDHILVVFYRHCKPSRVFLQVSADLEYLHVNRNLKTL
jgi:hypothetical protein